MPRHLVAVVLAGLLVACAPAAPAEAPEATVSLALQRLAAKDVEGLRALACAGQEDLVRDQLRLLGGALGAEGLAGVDLEAVFDAVDTDVSGVEVGDPTIEGDVAQVPVSGDVRFSFDRDAIVPLVMPILERLDEPLEPGDLDRYLDLLEATGEQGLPLVQTIRLVREDGAWKVCQPELDAR
jgi:hypothetical protein